MSMLPLSIDISTRLRDTTMNSTGAFSVRPSSSPSSFDSPPTSWLPASTTIGAESESATPMRSAGAAWAVLASRPVATMVSTRSGVFI
ncbi:hypothetical protein D3C72_1843770 [compost metagenome]